MLRITLFHTFSVSLEGESIDHFSSAGVRALLAYLAMHPHQPQARDSLTHLLYADFDERKARQNFRKTLSRLRAAFDSYGQISHEQIFTITDGTISFDPQIAYQVDVLEFEAGWKKAQTNDTVRIERSRYVAHLLRQTVGWYRGEFLSDLAVDSTVFEAWVYRTDGRLRQLALTAWHRLAHHAHVIGDHFKLCAGLRSRPFSSLTIVIYL